MTQSPKKRKRRKKSSNPSISEIIFVNTWPGQKTAAFLRFKNAGSMHLIRGCCLKDLALLAFHSDDAILK